MDTLMEKMQGILSDPESMQQISELARMLQGEADPAPQEQKSPQTGLDPALLMRVGEIVNAAGKEDANTALLHALRPHLREKRQEKVDRAIKLLQLLTVWNLLKEKGILQNLL